jgi:GT2 family glycosyltransferase
MNAQNALDFEQIIFYLRNFNNIKHDAPKPERVFKVESSTFKINVIIPVYGNKNMLNLLLEDLDNQTISFVCYVIDDASVEEGFAEFLTEVEAKYFRWLKVVRKPINQGFVDTVNLGLSLCNSDVVILNSDIRICPNFLEEIISPIWMDRKIASVSPMTNSGGILSIPIRNNDHDVPNLILSSQLGTSLKKWSALVLGADEIQMVPTGVGFAMAMNIDVIEKIGRFSLEFAPAYGEEVDWCRRALDAGYKSVAHAGLFVWHKHGESYGPMKEELLNKHNSLISQKYPEFDLEVQSFLQSDPLYSYKIVQAMLISNSFGDVGVTFSHQKGGGSALWRERKSESSFEITVAAGNVDGKFNIQITLWGEILNLNVSESELWELLSMISPSFIEIGSIALLSNSNSLGFVKGISNYLSLNPSAMKKIVIHDYYSICPSYNLLNYQRDFCDVPIVDVCNKCFDLNPFILTNNTEIDIIKWRETHLDLLEKVDFIVILSPSAEGYINRAFGKMFDKYLLIEPFKLLPEIHVKSGTQSFSVPGDRERLGFTTILTIGNLNFAKGSDILNTLSEFALKNRLKYKFVHLGAMDIDIIGRDNFEFHGTYSRENLAVILNEIKPHLILIPSVWPETYCFTAEEVWQLGYSVAAVSFGAIGDRFNDRDRTLLFSDVDGMRDPMNFFEQVSQFLSNS